jgi:hypothetical protein
MLEFTPNYANGKIGPKHKEAGRLLVLSNRAPIRIVSERGRRRIEPTVGGVGATFLRLLERYWLPRSCARSIRRCPSESSGMCPFHPNQSCGFFPGDGSCSKGCWELT